MGGAPPRGRSVDEEVKRGGHHRIQHDRTEQDQVEHHADEPAVELEVHEVADHHEELDRHHDQQRRNEERAQPTDLGGGDLHRAEHRDDDGDVLLVRDLVDLGAVVSGLFGVLGQDVVVCGLRCSCQAGIG